MKTFRNDKLEMKKLQFQMLQRHSKYRKPQFQEQFLVKGVLVKLRGKKFLNISKQTTISPMLLQKDWHNRKPTILHLQFPEIAIL